MGWTSECYSTRVYMDEHKAANCRTDWTSSYQRHCSGPEVETGWGRKESRKFGGFYFTAYYFSCGDLVGSLGVFLFKGFYAAVWFRGSAWASLSVGLFTTITAHQIALSCQAPLCHIQTYVRLWWCLTSKGHDHQFGGRCHSSVSMTSSAWDKDGFTSLARPCASSPAPQWALRVWMRHTDESRHTTLV